MAATEVEQARAAIEEHMLAQADSVGELLEQFKDRIPSALIDGAGWNRLVERANALPVSLATSGFGFELRLHESEPNADLGVALFHGTLSAAHFKQWAQSQPEDSYAQAVVGILRDMERDRTSLHGIAHAKLLLEFDIDQAPFPTPGIFLYPSADSAGEVQATEDLSAITDAVVSACGWAPDTQERRHAERLFEAKPPSAHVGTVGGFPDRARALRVAVTGIANTEELTTFLRRAGWPGQPEGIASFVGNLESQNAFGYLAAHVDVDSDGIRPELGVSYYPPSAQWLKDVEPWERLISGLSASELVVPEKLSTLAESWAGTEAVFGRRGMLFAVRGIHHFKTTLTDERVDAVKAYVFCWLSGGFTP